MAVSASLVSRAQTVLMAAGGSWRARAWSTLAASTRRVPMAAPPPAPDTQVDTRAAGGPDCSWPAHAGQQGRTGSSDRPPAPDRRPDRPSPMAGPRPGPRPTRRGCPSSRGARPDRAGGGTGRTAPLRRCSPMAPAAERRPSRQRRKPRFDSWAQRTSPEPFHPARPQRVETPVVADPEAGIGLDVVTGQRAERRPGRQERGSAVPRRTRRGDGARRAGPGPPRGRTATDSGSSGSTVSGSPVVSRTGGHVRRRCLGVRSWRSV